jgi:hypothetical protein
MWHVGFFYDNETKERVMLPNIDQTFYPRFKKEGYRIKIFQKAPVTTIREVVQLAYLDVNRTIVGINSEQSNSFKETVVSFIEKLLSNTPTNQIEFDQLHQKCCKQCLEYSSPTGANIHYGQAQKLLNMSLKYLYNEYATYKGKLNQFNFPDNNVEQFFHLPIDNQIIDSLVGKSKFIKSTSLPWSKWTYNHYIQFQHQLRKRIRGKCCSIEVDYMLWNTRGASLAN